MPVFPPLAPILADGDAIIGAIIFLITVVGWVANLVSNKNQKGPPVANRPRPPQRPRDEKLQQEINIFIEDAGGQKKKGAANRASNPTGRPRPADRFSAGSRPATQARPLRPASLLASCVRVKHSPAALPQ